MQMLFGLLIVQIALNPITYFFISGLITIVIASTLSVAIIWLFRRKTKRSLRLTWLLIAIFIINLAIYGTFSFWPVYTKIPEQRNQVLKEWNERTGMYENKLFEWVLVHNPPRYGEPLRDAMVRYFNNATKDEKPRYYNYRSISFYINNSSTRVFEKNQKDPSRFGHRYFGDT